MKFTLSLLLVVVFATYKFGETLPTRNMAYDNDEGIVNMFENIHTITLITNKILFSFI